MEFLPHNSKDYHIKSPIKLWIWIMKKRFKKNHAKLFIIIELILLFFWGNQNFSYNFYENNYAMKKFVLSWYWFNMGLILFVRKIHGIEKLLQWMLKEKVLLRKIPRARKSNEFLKFPSVGQLL